MKTNQRKRRTARTRFEQVPLAVLAKTLRIQTAAARTAKASPNNLKVARGKTDLVGWSTPVDSRQR